MAFGREPIISPIGIGQITVRLTTHEADSEMGSSAEFRIEVEYSDGQTRIRQGNLTPHLTPQQISALQTFMANLRTQAETQILS